MGKRVDEYVSKGTYRNVFYGTLVGKYSYTAFGECIVKVNEGGIAEKNPIRYRGYYYDTETSLY